MPSPVVYATTQFDPFPPPSSAEFAEQSTLFYVTDRAVAGPEDSQPHYTNQRGQLARAGTVDVQLSPAVRDWNEFVRLSLSGSRDREYLLTVTDVAEFGVLPYSVADLYPDPPSPKEMAATGREFARQINAQLAKTRNKDVFIYVHGYNVDFEYSTLVAREMEHFLGYQGAFIAYNWAATPKRLAYFRDQESAVATRRNLRSLIEFLSDNTNARRINVIGYSAGSRLVFETTYQLALKQKGGARSRLGDVVLISSDLDRSFFAHSLADGLLNTVDRLSLYLSGTDAALGVSSFVFGRERLGQTWEENDVWPSLTQALASLDKLEIIDVTDAEEASAGNGHAFFRSSPWASSDLFLSVLTGLTAGERGLVRQENQAIWHFPPDYPQRLSRIKGSRLAVEQ